MSNRARVVVALDGSQTSGRALRWACDYAASTGAEVTAVRVWGTAVAHVGGVDSRRLDAVRETHQQIARSTTPFDPPVRQRVVEGDVVAALIDESEGADLLVVGSRGHGALASFMLGSVSRQVAERSGCPVVIVRDRKRSPQAGGLARARA